MRYRIVVLHTFFQLSIQFSDFHSLSSSSGYRIGIANIQFLLSRAQYFLSGNSHYRMPLLSFSTSITCTHRSKKKLHRYLTTIKVEKYMYTRAISYTHKHTQRLLAFFHFICSHLYNVIIISLDGKTNSTKYRNIYPFSSFLTAVDIVVIRS